MAKCVVQLRIQVAQRPTLALEVVQRLTAAGVAVPRRHFLALVGALASTGNDAAQTGLAALIRGLTRELLVQLEVAATPDLGSNEPDKEAFIEDGGFDLLQLERDARMLGGVLRVLVLLPGSNITPTLWEALMRLWSDALRHTTQLSLVRLRDEVPPSPFCASHWLTNMWLLTRSTRVLFRRCLSLAQLPARCLQAIGSPRRLQRCWMPSSTLSWP